MKPASTPRPATNLPATAPSITQTRNTSAWAASPTPTQSKAISRSSSAACTLGVSDQSGLTQRMLPNIFGDRMFRKGIAAQLLAFDVLYRLVRIAFQTIRMEDDNQGQGGVVSRPMVAMLPKALAAPCLGERRVSHNPP